MRLTVWFLILFAMFLLLFTAPRAHADPVANRKSQPTVQTPPPDLGCCPNGCPEPAVCPPGYTPPPTARLCTSNPLVCNPLWEGEFK